MSSARTNRLIGTGTIPSHRISPNVALKNALASGLLALHVNLRDNEVITHLAEKFLQQFVLLKSKEKARLKFESNTYIPLSCRIMVDLKGSLAISKSDPFTALELRLKNITDTFKTETTAVFKDAADLEIKNVRQALMKTVVRFADMLMKQRLLINDVCREHTKSTELTIMVFITEALPPTDIRMGEGADDDEPGIDVYLYREMLKLTFGTSKDELYKALDEKRNPGNQPDALSETEKGIITQVQNDLKVCFTHCINSYTKKSNERKMESETKELLLLTATADAGDDTNVRMDEDGNNNNAALPPTVETINDLIKAAIIAHDNEKRNKTNSSVKDKRGAKSTKKKKQTNGGGASKSKTNQTSQKSKTNKQSSSSKKKTSKSKNQSNSQGRRRRGKADAVDSDTAEPDQQGKRQRSNDKND